MDCPLKYDECKYGPVYREVVVDPRANSPVALPGYQELAKPTYVMKPICCKIYKAERNLPLDK